MNYIKRFQNTDTLSVSAGNSYSEDQMMHTFLDNFHQGGKYSAQVARYQTELRRETNFTDQKPLSISSLQTNDLNLESSSGFGRNIDRANTVPKKCTFCEGTNHSAEKCFNSIRQEKVKAHVAGHSYNRQTERTPQNILDVDLKIT